MAKGDMFLYGKNSVIERLKLHPRSIKRIFIDEGFDNPVITGLAAKNHIHIKRVSEKELYKIKDADRLQGIVAEVERFKYADFEELIESGKSSKTSFLFIDSLNDPHNLGSIIRIAACFGNFAVVIPAHNSCEVTDAVMHVASGGENYVPVCMVENLTNALIKAKQKDFWIIGAVVDGGDNINKVSLPFPLCLVLGSEGKGIRHGILNNIEMKVTLPMEGAKLSLNVAMAAAIFCHEIARQRGLNEK